MNESCASFAQKFYYSIFFEKTEFTKFLPEQRLNYGHNLGIINIESELKPFLSQVVDLYCILRFFDIKCKIGIIKIYDFLIT